MKYNYLQQKDQTKPGRWSTGVRNANDNGAVCMTRSRRLNECVQYICMTGDLDYHTACYLVESEARKAIMRKSQAKQIGG